MKEQRRLPSRIDGDGVAQESTELSAYLGGLARAEFSNNEIARVAGSGFAGRVAIAGEVAEAIDRSSKATIRNMLSDCVTPIDQKITEDIFTRLHERTIQGYDAYLNRQLGGQ
ncbi:hypothetical protein GS464_29440 [Rhodococcus hoagii]|nr:hypothetical protein [Prescottella equi]